MDNLYSSEIEEVSKIAEQILQCLIYRLLKKLIVKESAEGYVEYSSIPAQLLNQLKREEEKFESFQAENNVDNLMLHKLMQVIEDQADYTLQKYHNRYHQLVLELDLNENTDIAGESYIRIAKKLFNGADLSWYHVIALLCFGTEVALYIVREGWKKLKEFLEQIVQFTVDFIVKEEIADWIRHHGGWMAMIDFFDGDCSNRGFHILSIMAFYELTNFESAVQAVSVVAVAAGVSVALYHLIKQAKGS